MKKNITLTLLCFIFTGQLILANPDSDYKIVVNNGDKVKDAKFSPYKPREIFADDLKFNRNFADQVKKERAAVSNALGLSEEQAKARVEMTRKNTALLEGKFRVLYEENYRLKLLKYENASKSDIETQEQKINAVKRDIKSVIEQENKDFYKILDREQRSKLKMIQKLHRKAMKESAKQKNYYKSNPKMRPFALPEKHNFDDVTGELE